MSRYSKHIKPFVDTELLQAAKLDNQPQLAFACLERAHVLGQASTHEHVRVHWHMFQWAIRQGNVKEQVGQLMRIIGAVTKTVFGLVPEGNTGGSNVSPFRRMPISSELRQKISLAKQASQK